jgi:AraC family transcriptional regulator
MLLGKLGVRLQVDPPGVTDAPAPRDPHILIHVGHPVEIACERGGHTHRGLSVHGDVDIIPAGVASRWTIKKPDCALIVRVPQELLQEAAAGLEMNGAQIALLNRFQMRDTAIEHLCWALKAEMENHNGNGSGRFYSDCIGMALACRLLQGHSEAAPVENAMRPGAMPAYRLRRVLAYIEEHLSDDLSLAALAAISGLSVSHCQRGFRETMGCSIHRYVLQRRVEHAKLLLAEKKFSIGEVALAVGFAHQSHLAYHMRRFLGVTPSGVRQTMD